MTNRYDLHMHSIKSDGTHTPKELLYLAKKAGLQGISITDHDTTEAYTKELFALANELGIALFPGVEITSRYLRVNIHVLAYGFSLTSERFHAFLDSVREKRRKRNELVFTYLQDHGIEITSEDLSTVSCKNSAVLGRLHIAKILCKKGYVSTVEEAFQRYLNDYNKPWEKSPKANTEIVIEEIHQAGGKAVLAHPFFLPEEEVEGILSLPFDGIEARYGNIDKIAEEKWMQIAKEKGWATTGGSDFHGCIKPKVCIGASWSTEQMIHELFYP